MPAPSHHSDPRGFAWATTRADRALGAALVIGCAAMALRRAWLCDDAFITLRTLEHLLSGYGLRYNVDERVQAYTHPLWLLWLLPGYALSRDAWTFPMLLGVATSAGALWLAVRGASDRFTAVLLAAVWLGSKSAVDYATSGLENPLENLLLALFVAEGLGASRAHRLALLAGLLGLTRLDALWLVLPATIGCAWTRREARAAWALVAPLAVWHGGALLYYGSVLPNSALAKLGTGLPAGTLALRSVDSFAWVTLNDPLVWVAIAAGLVAAGGQGPFGRALALGIGLHLGWLVWIGGDFMGGRFFVAPAWLGMLLASRTRWTPAWLALVVSMYALPTSPVRGGRAEPRGGVVDEQAYYGPATGLWRDGDPARALPREFVANAVLRRGERVAVKSIIGLYGFTAGPGQQVIDRLGLADPLLSRLPAEPEGWRIGHFRRKLPEGYVASVREDRNLLTDPEVRPLYDAVRLATRAPLFAPGRGAAIVGLATGRWSPKRRDRPRSGNRPGSRRWPCGCRCSSRAKKTRRPRRQRPRMTV
jgi:arabinofuranosyltransferase